MKVTTTMLLLLASALPLAAGAGASTAASAATASNQYVVVEGNKIAYRKIGQGPTIILATSLRRAPSVMRTAISRAR